MLSNVLGVYYSQAVWRFDPFLSVGLRKNAPFLSGWRLRFHRAVEENSVFCSRFVVDSNFYERKTASALAADYGVKRKTVAVYGKPDPL